MKSTRLLSITRKLCQINRGAFGSGYSANVEYAVQPDAIARGNAQEIKSRSQEFFEGLPDDELKELQTILDIISYRNGNREEHKTFIRTMLSTSVDDLSAWSRKLRVVTPSREEILKNLQRRSTAGIIRDLETYIHLLPISNLKRNLMNITLAKAKH